MKTAKLIGSRIEAIPRGEPFTTKEFYGFGTRAAIDKALSRLAQDGKIERVTRGVYVYPRESRFVGRVGPDPLRVASAIARATGATFQVQGAEAARQLGLSKHVPMQPVFLTSGPSRCFRLGKLLVRMRHACPRKLAMAGRPAGMALAALRYLGKARVAQETLEVLRCRLPAVEFEALQTALAMMPAWLVDVFHEYGRRERRA